MPVLVHLLSYTAVSLKDYEPTARFSLINRQRHINEMNVVTYRTFIKGNTCLGGGP